MPSQKFDMKNSFRIIVVIITVIKINIIKTYIKSRVKQRNLRQFFTRDFLTPKKAYLQTPKIFTHTPKHPYDPLSY